MIPSSITKVGAETGHKIDFTSPKAKRKALDRLLDGELVRTQTSSTSKVSTATKGEFMTYLLQLQKASPTAAVFSSMPSYCDAFEDPAQPFSTLDSLHCLHNVKMVGAELTVLRLHCKNLAEVELSRQKLLRGRQESSTKMLHGISLEVDG